MRPRGLRAELQRAPPGACRGRERLVSHGATAARLTARTRGSCPTPRRTRHSSSDETRSGTSSSPTSSPHGSRCSTARAASGRARVLRAGVAHHLRQLRPAEPRRARHARVRRRRVQHLARRPHRRRSRTASGGRGTDPSGHGLEPAPSSTWRSPTPSHAWSERCEGDLSSSSTSSRSTSCTTREEERRGHLRGRVPARGRTGPTSAPTSSSSIREDALAKLDRFKGRIPNLFDNYLRIEHLDREAARAAIEKPARAYNRVHATDGSPVAHRAGARRGGPGQVETGQVCWARPGAARSSARGRRAGSDRNALPPARDDAAVGRGAPRGLALPAAGDAHRLGGAERIVRTHLDEAMGALPRTSRTSRHAVFHHLVTPSGTKIAHTAPDLADYADRPGAELEPILETLSGPGIRILRPVAPPARPAVDAALRDLPRRPGSRPSSTGGPATSTGNSARKPELETEDCTSTGRRGRRRRDCEAPSPAGGPSTYWPPLAVGAPTSAGCGPAGCRARRRSRITPRRRGARDRTLLRQGSRLDARDTAATLSRDDTAFTPRTRRRSYRRRSDTTGRTWEARDRPLHGECSRRPIGNWMWQAELSPDG